MTAATAKRRARACARRRSGPQAGGVAGARGSRRHCTDRSKVSDGRSPGAHGTIRAMAGPGPTIQIPRWIQLVVLPVAARVRVPAREDARARALPLPHGRRDRVHAQPARPRPHATEGAARSRGRSSSTRSSSPWWRLSSSRSAPSPSTRRGRPPTGSTSTSPRSRRPDRRPRSSTSTVSRRGSTTTASSRSRSASRSTSGSTGSSAGEISGYAQDAISFAQGAAFSFVLLLFSVVLIIVISIYMLLDMQRLERTDRLALSAPRRRAADPADRGGAVGLPEGPGDPLDRHRDERGRRACTSSA